MNISNFVGKLLIFFACLCAFAFAAAAYVSVRDTINDCIHKRNELRRISLDISQIGEEMKLRCRDMFDVVPELSEHITNAVRVCGEIPRGRLETIFGCQQYDSALRNCTRILGMLKGIPGICRDNGYRARVGEWP